MGRTRYVADGQGSIGHCETIDAFAIHGRRLHFPVHTR